MLELTTRARRKMRSVAGILLAGTMAFAAPAAAQQPSHDHAQAPAHPATTQTPDKGPGMMPAMRERMAADHHAADARLQPLLERMKSATGEARIDAMAAVVAELAAQRTAMRSKMDEMAHTMEQCPMMSGADHAPGQKP